MIDLQLKALRNKCEAIEQSCGSGKHGRIISLDSLLITSELKQVDLVLSVLKDTISDSEGQHVSVTSPMPIITLDEQLIEDIAAPSLYFASLVELPADLPIRLNLVDISLESQFPLNSLAESSDVDSKCSPTVDSIPFSCAQPIVASSTLAEDDESNKEHRENVKKGKKPKKANVAATIVAARPHLFFDGHGEIAWAGLRYHLAPASQDPNSDFRIVMGLQAKPEMNGTVVLITGAECDGRMPVRSIDRERIRKYLLKLSNEPIEPSGPGVLIRRENLVWFDI